MAADLHEPVDLPRDEIHVWIASLDQPPERLARLSRTLSQPELQRARRQIFERDRRWLLARLGLRRATLARYVHADPAELRFSRGTGKPRLASRPAGISFSCSYSRGLALYAVARGRRVGIDVEGLRPVPHLVEIARSSFAPDEYDALRALPEPERHEAFFNCWTRKEAYVKAVGEGLARPLDGFSVSLRPGEPARLLHVRDMPVEAARWKLVPLSPDEGYVAVVAAEGHGWRLRRGWC